MQTLKTFKATVRLDDGALQDVTVHADTWGNARAMLEAQYGKDSVLGVNDVRHIDLSADRDPATDKLSFGDYLAGSAGIAAFIIASYKLGLDWKWSLGIAAIVWAIGFSALGSRHR